jgi:Tol biopolymer transport system component
VSRGFVLAALLGQAASVQEPVGTHERRLTRNAFDDTHPAWSPDSKTIVFFSHPYYLPTGNQIVFQSPRDHADEHDVDLYVMDANGRGQRRLLARSGFNGVPVPSRNGKRIAFQRGIWNEAIKKFHWELYVVDADGRNERQLTDNSWSSQVASWFP